MGSDTARTERERLARHLRLLQEVGLSRTVQARQLAAAGFPADLIQKQFADPAATLIPATLPGQGGVAPALQGALDKLAQRVAAASVLPADRSVPVASSAAAAQRGSARPSPDLADGISFQYVPLIQCSFPHMDPGALTHFSRRNGWLELTLSTARADTGLPYGVPARLLTMFCASEAIRTRSPEIYLGATLHEFLRRLDVPITRGERGSLRVYANQLLRLVHCALSIDEDIKDPTGRVGLHIRQAHFVEEARLWWDEASGVGQGSSLVLSPVLYDSILERSAPLSTRAIRMLRKSPMDLDVYAWLVHRLFHLSRPSTVTWEQLSGQFGHGYTLLRKFRAFFGESLTRVTAAYPEANLKLTETGVTLLPSRPHISRLP